MTRLARSGYAGALLGLWLAAAMLPAESAPVRFELVPLGVLGGGVEGNGSCFLLRPAGRESPAIMLDGGSPVSGIMKWKNLEAPGISWRDRMQAVARELARVEAAFMSHAHLDHNYGFVLKSPMHLDGPLRGSRTVVYGNPATIDAYRQVLFARPVWGDFTQVPSPQAPAFALESIEAGKATTVAGFQVEAVDLAHPVPSSAFLIATADGQTFTFFGDTGPTQSVWDRLRPVLEAGRLRAIAIETSFQSDLEDLAIATGHLTPALLVLELNKLTRSVPTEELPAGRLDLARAGELAGRIAKDLEGVRVLVHHIKPFSFTEVSAEIRVLQEAGLPLEILHQARPLRF